MAAITTRQRLENARHASLHVHRALLEAEQIRYERQHGRVRSTGAFLQLVLHGPWFDWLRPISELINQEMAPWLNHSKRELLPYAGARRDSHRKSQWAATT